MHRTPITTRSRTKLSTSKLSSSKFLIDCGNNKLNKTFESDESDSLLEELLFIPNQKEVVDENGNNSINSIINDVPNSFIYNSGQTQTVSKDLFEKLKQYIDIKFAELTNTLMAKFNDVHTNFKCNKNQADENNCQKFSQNGKNHNMTKTAKAKMEEKEIQTDTTPNDAKIEENSDIRAKCKKIEMENNLNTVILENISIKGRISGYHLACQIFNRMNFNTDERPLENAKVFNMKNGNKKLIMKFYSRLVRNDFMNLFNSFSSIRNYDLGFYDGSFVYMKEKLTKDNLDVYSRASAMLSRGVIDDFMTYLGHVFVLPKNSRSFDWKNYVKINDLFDLNEYDDVEKD